MKLNIGLVFLIVFAATSITEAQIIWVGNDTLTPDWNTKENWRPQNLPSYDRDVSIAGKQQRIPILSQNEVFAVRSLTILDSAQVQIDGLLHVSDRLNIGEGAGIILSKPINFTDSHFVIELSYAGQLVYHGVVVTYKNIKAHLASVFTLANSPVHNLTVSYDEEKRAVVLNMRQEPEEDDEASYSISIGASFDFLDKLKVNNVYASIGLFTPDMWDIGKGYTLGLDGGFFQYRTIPEKRKGQEEIDRFTNVGGVDTLYIENTYKTETGIKKDHIGFYLNPTIRMAKNFYLFLNIEFRKRVITETTTFTLAYPDSSANSKPGLTYGEKPQRRFAEPVTSVSTVDETLIGPGAIFLYDDSNISFHFTPAFANNFKPPYFSSKSWSYLLQFDVTEKSSYITIGGEVRRFAQGSGSELEYLVYLAKEYDITFLGSLFGSGKE